ncbi:hypothetical protein [Acidithiobacillus sp.]|nr:hypothetical protein [Acidithiobacillus sp.]
MIRLRLSLALSYEVNAPGSDFIFNIHAAHTNRQKWSMSRWWSITT